jgi:hypothetical protein
MGGWLWAFGIPLFAAGPFLAVPRAERPPPRPMTPGQRRLVRWVLAACAVLLVLVLVPWWARVILVLAPVVAAGLLVAWARRAARRRPTAAGAAKRWPPAGKD